MWLIIGLSVMFAALALVNTAAMSTGERRASSPRSACSAARPGRRRAWSRSSSRRSCSWPSPPAAAIAAVAMIGVPNGVRGIPLIVPVAAVGGLLMGTVGLGLATGAVAARLALRASPASAMRAQEG